MTMEKIFFAADLHFGHRRILEFKPGRPFADRGDIDAHDEFVIGQWNDTIAPRDRVYILGDLCLKSVDGARRLLERPNGRKYLVAGNHDSCLRGLGNYFVKVSQIMTLTVRRGNYPFLGSDREIVMCHYPLADWPGRESGAINLHGHCHGSFDALNRESRLRRFDVGYDSGLGRRCGGFVSLEKIEEILNIG